MKFIIFFLFLWAIFALLGPDPDPQHWLQVCKFYVNVDPRKKCNNRKKKITYIAKLLKILAPYRTVDLRSMTDLRRFTSFPLG